MKTHMDLFSGIGGFAIAAKANGYQTIGFCEIEPYCQAVLSKNFPNIPIHDNIKTLRGSDLPAIDLLTGGYPCQPFSHAGKRNGENDDRHLWPEIARLLREMDAAAGLPTWCLFENVAGHITMGLDAVLSELESIGYACWPIVIPACAVDARHRRDRVWILANAGGKRDQRLRDEPTITSELRQGGACGSQNSINGALADSERIGRQGQGGASQPSSPETSGNRQTDRLIHDRENREGAGESQPGMGRVAHGLSEGLDESGFCRWPEENLEETPRINTGIPNREHRLKGLGNAIVPQVAFEIMRAIVHTDVKSPPAVSTDNSPNLTSPSEIRPPTSGSN